MQNWDLKNSPAFNQHSPGVYGETDRATFGIELVEAKQVQYRRLSRQPEFVYYLPYLPMSFCPDAPDVMAEYVKDRDCWITVTRWKVDYPLIPKLLKKGIETSQIFGIPARAAVDYFNFANGVVVKDQRTQAIFRISVKPITLIEPAVSMAQPAEKILANRLTVFYYGVNTVDNEYTLVPSPTNPKECLIRRVSMRDEELWKMMMLAAMDELV